MFLKIHLFLLLLFILISISLSSSAYISPSVFDSGDPNPFGFDYDGSKNYLTCCSVPYPFGPADNALPGFKLDCPKEKPWFPPILSISNNTYIIQEISLQGYMKIFAGPIHKSCFDGHNQKWNESQGSRRFNLDGTPFTLSEQHNMLTVVDCSNLVLISTQAESVTVTSGCVTFCDPQGTYFSGSCSGKGCCQATLPGNLKSFDLQFMQVNNLTYQIQVWRSSAYFTQRDDFQSNQGDYNNYETIFSDYNLVQLDWAIGNKSCGTSRNDIGSLACKNNSYCYDSPSMVGYLCNCSQGYQGNPYTIDGCTDIDECGSDLCVGHGYEKSIFKLVILFK